MIHPSAHIDSAAKLAPDVKVGANVIIEGAATIGAGCTLFPASQVIGAVIMGENNTVGRGAIIGETPQDLSFDPETPSGVLIGSNNTFRENVTVHRSGKSGENTTIGDHNFLMVDSHLGHDCIIGDHNVLANNVLLGGHVHLGSHAFLGGGSGFHQFVRVGDRVMAQGNSSISQDIPPFTMASQLNNLNGLNSIGLRRAGFSPDERAHLKRLYKLLFASGLALTAALKEAALSPPEAGTASAQLLEFASASTKKGICRHKTS